MTSFQTVKEKSLRREINTKKNPKNYTVTHASCYKYILMLGGDDPTAILSSLT